MSLANPKALAGGQGGSLFCDDAAATQPTLSVSGRVDGGGYTVSAGARSITITAEAGATLSTTVKKASDGSTVTVTDSATTTPDWTAPAGGSTGESVQVTVTATKDGLTSQVSFTERVAGSGGSASWVTGDTLAGADMTALAAFGAGTQSFDWDGTTMDGTCTRFSSSTGTAEGVAGVGPRINPVTNTGTTTLAFAITDIIPSWARAYSMNAPIAIHVPVTLTYSAVVDNGVTVGLNNGTTHNSGDFRGIRTRWQSASSELKRIRINTTESTISGTFAPVTGRVFTLILNAAEIVEVMDTTGSTPPTPAPGGASTFMAGSDQVGALDTTAVYDTLYLIINSALGCTVQMGDISWQRWQ